MFICQKNQLKLSFKIDKYKGLFSFFHKSKSEDGDGYARMFGLKMVWIIQIYPI